MHTSKDSVLNKRIEIPWLTQLHHLLNHPFGTSALAKIIICLECISGFSWLLHNHVGIDLQVWLEFIAVVGPFLCLFLVGLLVVAYFRNHRRETVLFLTGLVAGLVPVGVFLWWAATH